MPRTKTQRRRLFPMPIEGLFDSELAMTLPAAAFGMVARLMIHFYATGCRPLPASDHELRMISRAHAPTWRHWKPQVMLVFEECRPALERYHQARLTKATTIVFASRAGGEATARRLALQAQANPSPASIATHTPTRLRNPATPSPLPPVTSPARMIDAPRR